VIGEAELLAKFKSLGEAVQGMALAQTAQAGGTVIENAAKARIKDNNLIRTRNLSRSIHTEVKMDGPDRAEAEIGTNVEYAPIHEFGGVVTAKKSNNLAIPVGTYKGSPLSHSDLRVRMSVSGNLVMLDKSGRVQYVLKKSVEVPAQPFLRPAFDEKREEAKDVMGRAFKKLIEKAAK